MSEREEAAEAARAKGREKALFEVVEPLSRNGELLAIGERVKMSRADADILIGFGKLKPAKGKAKAAEDSDVASEQNADVNPLAETEAAPAEDSEGQ